MIAAIDFDHTIWDTPNNQPMPGAKDAINLLRENGVKVIIHSCNTRNWIEKCMNNHDLRYDWIWDHPGKPVADIYIDDCGFRFQDWKLDMPGILNYLNVGNPMVNR